MVLLAPFASVAPKTIRIRDGLKYAVPHSAPVGSGCQWAQTGTTWRFAIGLISFAFPYSNGADPRFMSDSQFDLQEGPSPWPVDDEQLPSARIRRSEPLGLNPSAFGFA